MTNKPGVRFKRNPTIEQCMYTGENLDGSVEHVLPEAIGSTLKCDKLITSAVNTLSSRTLEPALFAPLRALCHQLGVAGKRGGRRLRVAAKDGRVVELGPDQRPRVVDKPKPVISRTPSGTTISAEATDYKQLMKLVRSTIAGDWSTVTVEKLTVQKEKIVADPVKSSLGGPLWVNAVRKSSLSLLGYFDPVTVRSSELEEARFLVFSAMVGDPTDIPGCQCLALLDGNSIIADLGISIISPVDHTLVVSCEPDSQRIIAFLRVLGAVDSALVLSSTYTGPARTFIYHRNPMGTSSVDTLVLNLDRSCPAMARMLHLSNQRRLELLDSALKKTIRYAHARAQQQAFDCLPNESLPEWLFNDGTPIESESKFSEAAKEFAIDFLLMVDVAIALDSDAGNRLIDKLRGRLSRFYRRYSGRVVGSTTKRDIGNDWLREIATYLQSDFEAVQLEVASSEEGSDDAGQLDTRGEAYSRT